MVKRDHGGNVEEIARELGLEERGLLDFSANINPLGYSKGVHARIFEDFDCILNYPDLDSHEAIEALAGYHGVDRESISLGNGSTEFMYWLPLVFKPRRALIVVPAFSEYEKGLRLSGTAVSYFEADVERGFHIDTGVLKNRLKDIDLLYFCNPANPTGILTPRGEVAEIVHYAENAGVVSIIDEAFIDFYEEESIKHNIKENRKLIVMRSMTKFFGMPGLRLGYLMAHPEMIERVEKNRPPWMVNAFAQRAAGVALADEAYIEHTREYVSKEREYMCGVLSDFSGLTVFESKANYLLLRMEEGLELNAPELRERLLARHILIRDCSNYRGLSDRYFRIAVKKHDENAVLLKGLEEVLK